MLIIAIDHTTIQSSIETFKTLEQIIQNECELCTLNIENPSPPLYKNCEIITR